MAVTVQLGQRSGAPPVPPVPPMPPPPVPVAPPAPPIPPPPPAPPVPPIGEPKAGSCTIISASAGPNDAPRLTNATASPPA